MNTFMDKQSGETKEEEVIGESEAGARFTNLC